MLFIGLMALVTIFERRYDDLNTYVDEQRRVSTALEKAGYGILESWHDIEGIRPKVRDVIRQNILCCSTTGHVSYIRDQRDPSKFIGAILVELSKG